MRDVLLTIHILGAAGFIGAGAYSLVVLGSDVREMGLVRVMARDERLGNRFFGVVVGFLLLSGIGLVLQSDVYNWGDAFVLIGIGAIVASGILEGAIFGPAARRLAETPGPIDAGLRRMVWMNWALHIPLLVFVVYAMVAKLGA